MMVIATKDIPTRISKVANDLISLENPTINMPQDSSYDVRKEAHGQYEYILLKLIQEHLKIRRL